MIFFNQCWGESNAVRSLRSLHVVSILTVREESKISFVRVYGRDVGSEWRDGHQLAMYYSRIFGLFGQKSNSHFSRASVLESYPMKPNGGLIRIYRVFHLIDILGNKLVGGVYEEEKEGSS